MEPFLDNVTSLSLELAYLESTILQNAHEQLAAVGDLMFF